MLDLETCVHLQEEELARVVVEEELHRSRRAVAEYPRERERGRTHGGAEFVVDDRRRRLLDDLLVAALDRTFPLTEMNEIAVVVAQDLDLDVAGSLDIALEEHAIVTECVLRLALRGRDRLVEFGGRLDDSHPLATAAGGGFDQQRVADVVTGGRVVGRRQRRYAGVDCDPLRRQLVAHRLDDVRGRTDPRQTRIDDGSGERSVLRQEAVARVDCGCTARDRRSDDRRSVEVAAVLETDGFVGVGHERGVGVGVDVDGDGAHAHGPCRSEDAPCDLAAVRDEHGFECLGHSRNTP